jgi:hypothetical protein
MASKTYAEGDLNVSGELKIKVYQQNGKPTLGADHNIAIWIDTNDSNRTYLVFRRGASASEHIGVELETILAI